MSNELLGCLAAQFGGCLVSWRRCGVRRGALRFTAWGNRCFVAGTNNNQWQLIGDGIWDAGESITVTLLLNNEGSVANYTYPGIVLSENSDEVSMPDDYNFFWFYGIEAGTSMAATFEVNASEDANMGSEITFVARVA